MRTDDPVELALARRPSDERDYDVPLAALTGSTAPGPASGEHVRPQVGVRSSRAGNRLPGLVATGLAIILVAGVAGSLAIRNSAPAGPSPQTGDDYELTGLVNCFGQASGAFTPGPERASTEGCPLMAVPPAGYGAATWTLDAAYPYSAESTELHILVTEWACHGFETAEGRVAKNVMYRGDAVVVTLALHELGGAQRCPAPPPTPVVLKLDQPVGARALSDGGTWPATVVNPGRDLVTPTPAPTSGQAVLSVEQSGLTRTYHIVGRAPVTESEPFTLDAGLYYVAVACSQVEGDAGAAIVVLQQVGSDGAVVGEPYRVSCSAPAVSPLFGETRRLTGGSYRLDVPWNTTADITFEISPGSDAPALPRATVAPPVPLTPVLLPFAVPCPGASGVQAKFPCQAFDLTWLPSDPDAFYRIYESHEQAGTPAQPCDPATAELIIATSASLDRVRTGTYVPAAGSGGVCFFVAAVNSAGESARVAFPDARFAASSPNGGRTFGQYRVKFGDTMQAIATKYGVSYEQLLAANPQVADPNHIEVGQFIYIPWQSWEPPAS